MTDSLEEALRESAADLTLSIPASDVLSRGDRYRRRRRRGVTVGAFVAVAVAAFSVAALGARTDQVDQAGPSGDESVEFRVASWSGPVTNLSAAQLAESASECAGSSEGHGLEEPGWELPGEVRPVAAELRDSLVLTYFRKGRDYATCVLEATKGGGFRVKGRTAGRERVIPTGRLVALVTAGASDPEPRGGALSGVYFVIRTAPQVARLELAVAGGTYDSAADGLGFFWLPDGVLTEGELDAATVTALDADGDVLYRSRPGEDW